jgi:hypothetical protein
MPLIYEVTATSARCFDFTKHVESGSAPGTMNLAGIGARSSATYTRGGTVADFAGQEHHPISVKRR